MVGSVYSLVGSYFFKGNVIAVSSYLNSLMELWGELNNNPLFAGKNLVQKDDAPPHFRPVQPSQPTFSSVHRALWSK